MGYWGQVFRHAAKRYQRRVGGGILKLMGFIIQTAVLFVLLYFQPWIGVFADEAKLAGAGGAAVLVSALITFVFDFFASPPEIHASFTHELTWRQKMMTPRLTVKPLKGGGLVKLPYGTETPVQMGARIVNITGHHSILGLALENRTVETVCNVSAAIVSLRRAGDDYEILPTSIELGWMDGSPKGIPRYPNVPPKGLQRLGVFQLVEGGFQIFTPNTLPLEIAQGWCDGICSYEAVIAIDHSGGTPVSALVVLDALGSRILSVQVETPTSDSY